MTGGSKRNQTAKLLKIHQHSLPGQFLDACASWGDKLLFYFKLGYRILLHRIRSYLRLRSARGNQTYTAVFYHDRNSSIILENTNSSIGQHPLGMELWRGGFFGKGSLSRGEPTWYARMRAPLKERRAESLALQKRLLALLSLKNEIAQDSGASGDEDWQPESQDVEQYVLTPEETFFLAYAIGSLDVRYSEDTDVPLSARTLWILLCRNSHHPIDPLIDSAQTFVSHFAVRYAVYHYYRSRGWVVKCGLKFGTDFVLYRRGPSFKHSEYAVIIVPVFDRGKCESSKSWASILGMTRVCGQAKKKVLIAYIKIPRDMHPQDLQQPESFLRFQIWDVSVTRWVPSKSL